MESAVLGNVLGIISVVLGAIGIFITLQIKTKIDNKDKLIDSLITNTKKSQLFWKSFDELADKEVVIQNLEDKSIPCDFGVNSIRESQSYYISNENGYLFLLEIYHGDPEVMSPKYDTLALIIYKRNDDICSLSDFERIEQKRLKELKALIQNSNTYFSLANELINN